MSPAERVVCDCKVYFQALTSPSGPARKLLEYAARKKFVLISSEYVLQELRGVIARPQIRTQFLLTDRIVQDFLTMVNKCAVLIEEVPPVFEFPRDPKDAHYIDLALAADAKLIVSRDKDLLSLRDQATAEGRDFTRRYPTLLILTPPELLKLLDEPQPFS